MKKEGLIAILALASLAVFLILIFESGEGKKFESINIGESEERVYELLGLPSEINEFEEFKVVNRFPNCLKILWLLPSYPIVLSCMISQIQICLIFIFRFFKFQFFKEFFFCFFGFLFPPRKNSNF